MSVTHQSSKLHGFVHPLGHPWLSSSVGTQSSPILSHLIEQGSPPELDELLLLELEEEELLELDELDDELLEELEDELELEELLLLEELLDEDEEELEPPPIQRQVFALKVDP